MTAGLGAVRAGGAVGAGGWVQDLAGFRAAVREHRRAVGRTQQQLARAIGLHPHVLSHKLNGHGAVLTTPEVIGIVTTLASWGALVTRAQAEALLESMAVPPQALPAGAWAAPPLAGLSQGQPGVVSRAPAGAAPRLLPSTAAGRLAPAALPVLVTPLVGRAGELAVVTAAVAGGRLVTLTGTGGTGKTRLALEAARRLADGFPDGVAFADLAPVEDPGLVGVTLVAALGLTPRAAESAEAQLVAALRAARVLLVADNLEHLVEEAPLLGRLLAAAPGLRLLVTSRIPLRLYGEHQIRVPPLSLPAAGEPGASEAVQLFLARARAVASWFDPQGPELAATAGICRLLDGLPLAIELAAARVRLYPPQELLAQLEAQPALLGGGPRDVPHRQQTLRAALDWSYDLLTPPARGLFARVGVFAGSFDARAAAAVCDPDGDPDGMLERLAALAEHSLAEVSPGGPPRFWLLQPVREYALARLARTGQAGAVRARHLGHYLALATQARAHLDGPQAGVWLDRLAADFANIRAALDWARAEAEADGVHLDDGLRLATAAAAFWRRRGSVAEGALHLDRLLALQARHHTAAPATVAWAVLEASALACFGGDYPAAAGLARQGLELCGALGDPLGQSWAHRWLAEAAMGLGDLAAAEPHFRSARDLAGQAGDRCAEARALNRLAQVSRYQGRYDEAAAQLRRAQRALQAAGDLYGAGSVFHSLGEVARDAGKPDQARDLFRQALRASQQTRTTRGMAYALEGLAAVAAVTGDGQAALTYLGAAQALREQSASPLMPVDQAILDRFLNPGVAALTPRQREQALAEGRNRPLDEVIAEALGEAKEPTVPAGEDSEQGTAAALFTPAPRFPAS
jgi:predicted ATPase/Tfp pilus assembly protein PilF